MSKLSDFLKAQKIDSRRLIFVSKDLESLRPEDRALKLKKRSPKAEGENIDAAAPSKPRSGRPVSRPAMAAALNGKTVNGPTKTRILRAINQCLEKKKKQTVTLKELF